MFRQINLHSSCTHGSAKNEWCFTFGYPSPGFKKYSVSRLHHSSGFLVYDICLCGSVCNSYLIIQDAYVIINMYSVHMDETFWTDPEVFRPERHIDKFGQITKTDRLFPFGGGTPIALLTDCVEKTYLISLFNT